MTAASLFFVWNLIVSLLNGRRASDNPWDAWTLEWATSSPPPHENFRALPPIHSRRPLWDTANPDRPDPVVGSRGKVDQFKPEKNKTSIVSFIISESGFFGILILAFLYYDGIPHAGPNAHELDLLKTGLFSICLFSSSFTIWRAEVALHKDQRSRMIGWLIATIVLGGIFLAGQGRGSGHVFKIGISGR